MGTREKQSDTPAMRRQKAGNIAWSCAMVALALVPGAIATWLLSHAAFWSGAHGIVTGRHFWIGVTSMRFLDVTTAAGDISVAVGRTAFLECEGTEFVRNAVSPTVTCNGVGYFDMTLIPSLIMLVVVAMLLRSAVSPWRTPSARTRMTHR